MFSWQVLEDPAFCSERYPLARRLQAKRLGFPCPGCAHRRGAAASSPRSL